MTVSILTGHLGGGKTLYAVKRAGDYITAGRRVASNITFNTDKLCLWNCKTSYIKLPLVPRGSDLHDLGRAYDGDYNEAKNGLVILDEAGTWLNSHDWKDKDRRELFRWITHARKLGWDVMLIIQDYESLDAQIRRSVSEIVIKTAHLNRLLPIFGSLIPKIHIATARYYSPQGPKLFRHYMRGVRFYDCYDTRQAVSLETNITEDGEIIDARGSCSMLSAWHLKGRYRVAPPPASDYIIAGVFALLMALGAILSLLTARSPAGIIHNARRQLRPFFNSGSRFVIPVSAKSGNCIHV